MSTPTSNLRPIVLIDGSSDYVLILRQAFRLAGVQHPFVHLRSGEAAISFFNRSIDTAEPVPALIVIEIHLPGIDGFETLRWVRNCPSFLEVPTVILTKSALPEHIERAENLKADLFLTKPASIDGLGEIASRLREQWLKG